MLHTCSVSIVLELRQNSYAVASRRSRTDPNETGIETTRTLNWPPRGDLTRVAWSTGIILQMAERCVLSKFTSRLKMALRNIRGEGRCQAR